MNPWLIDRPIAQYAVTMQCLRSPMIRLCCVFVLTSAFSSVWCLRIDAQDTTQDSVSVTAASPETGSLDVFADELLVYAIRYDDSDAPLAFRRAPLLRWTNPVRNDQQGAVFVWMDSGRPQVVGSSFHYAPSGREATIHEFHSLSDRPLVATRDGKEFWHPSSKLKFSRLEGLPPPATSSQARQLQMRALSRRVTVQMTDNHGSVTQLRLLSRPVISYQPDDASGVDGAMFAFAAGGTDPDAFLLIENRTHDGQSAWDFAFARFHYNELAAQIDGSEVWQVEAATGMQGNFWGSKKFRDALYLSIRTY